MKRRTSIAQIPQTFTKAENPDRVSKSYSFQLITPMIGGDVESWVLNPSRPVRSQSVKGQLRFWWRTMQVETDSKRLLQLENSLFGGKTVKDNGKEDRIKSSVSILITGQKAKTTSAMDENLIPKYVGFPLQNGDETGNPFKCVTELSFSINISYPREKELEVINTLKLWCLFGGLGARTRRGTGSIYSEELMKDFTDSNAIIAFVKGLVGNAEVAHDAPYPMLNGCTLAFSQPTFGNDGANIWKSFLEKYGSYRQGPGVGRGNGDGKKPGRSYWPEPDALRRITGQNDSRHQPVHPDENWFPRAAYGLPIQFKFKDVASGDPKGVYNARTREYDAIQLTPAGKERWPSPVILKVIKLYSGNVIKCCLILNAAPPDAMNFEFEDKTLLKTHRLTPSELPLAHKGPDKQMKTNDRLRQGEDPYTALLRFLGLEVAK